MEQTMLYGNGWRHLYEDEKEKLRAYLVETHKIGNIFFKIPQFVCYFMTAVVIISIITEWESTYSKDIAQVLGMLFFMLPAMYAFFFFGPRWIAKQYNREITAIDNGLAVVCTKQITDKHVFAEGSNRSRRHVYKFQVFADTIQNLQSYVKTSGWAYEYANPGDMCNVVFFPKKEGEQMHSVFMLAFCENFKDVDAILNCKNGQV